MTSAPTVELSPATLEDTCLFQFPAMSAIEGFAHAITSRPWNMSLKQGPDIGQTVERRKKICRFLDIPFEGLTAPNQTHSPHVLRIRPDDIGAGRDHRRTALRFVDGLVCDMLGTAVMQFSADCPIVLVVEPKRRIFGTAHASWRGTVAGITSELLRQLKLEFDVAPSELIAGVCPCAGPLAYEVGEEVRRVALARLPHADAFFTSAGDSWRFDLRAANVDQLVRGGVDASKISVASNCTIGDRRFYSHRRDGPDTGRFALIAGFRGARPD